MKVVFIGAGNVATHLAIDLYKYDFDILQIYSRTIQAASELAKQVDAEAIDNLSSVITDADLYIFSVKDSVLDEVASQLPATTGSWVHTAGSIACNIFKPYTSHYGVIYPFQTFSKSRVLDWKTIPIFVEASDSETLNTIQQIAETLSDKVAVLSSDNREYLHLTGVFACNFTNHMYALSEQFLKKANLPFDVARPLIDETCAKIHQLSPQNAQTGPAVRFDNNVMNKHLALIDDEKTKEIYKLLSKSIYKTNKEK